jgi:hypothetical protein
MNVPDCEDVPVDVAGVAEAAVVLGGADVAGAGTAREAAAAVVVAGGLRAGIGNGARDGSVVDGCAGRAVAAVAVAAAVPRCADPAEGAAAVSSSEAEEQLSRSDIVKFFTSALLSPSRSSMLADISISSERACGSGAMWLGGELEDRVPNQATYFKSAHGILCKYGSL